MVKTNALNWAFSRVLSQYNDDSKLRLIIFFSAKHSALEYNYKIYDKKLLAIIKALEEWRPKL